MSEKDFARSLYALPERASTADDRTDESDLGPLPNEMPPAPDLSKLPPGALHSGTIETLIGQNEDLMARLKVNLRRCANLERQVVEQERAASDLRRINASITAQIQVLCEKENAWKERAVVAELERDGFKTRARLLESFRRRATKWVRPRFKRALAAEGSLYAREAELSATKARLARATERAESAEAAAARDRELLVEAYEAELAAAREEADRLRSERAYLKERSDRLDDARRKLAEAENRAIHAERRGHELERKLAEDVASLQDEMAGYRREAKKLAAELAAAKRSEEKLQAKASALSKRLSQSEDQFESLRAVWEDAQKSRDALAARNDALARVNQELARKLRESRSGATSASPAVEDPNGAAAIEAQRGEGFERIDALLAEIESGFTRQAPKGPEDDVARIRSLDFVEGADADKAP